MSYFEALNGQTITCHQSIDWLTAGEVYQVTSTAGDIHLAGSTGAVTLTRRQLIRALKAGHLTIN